MRWILLLGRLLFGGLLIWAAARHAMDASTAVAAATAHSIPYPEVIVLIATLALALGGASVLLGLMPRVGLGLIALSLIGTTSMMHAFWTVVDPAARSAEFAMFTSNTALLGAVMSMLAIPLPWPFSLDEGIARSGRLGHDLWGRITRSLRTAFSCTQGQTASPARVKSSTTQASPHAESQLSHTVYVDRVWTTSDGGSVLIQHLSGYSRWLDG
jgi:putative oxidoreductase